MAEITIVGDAVVITSALKLEDIRTIEKYRPNALTLMGGDDGKEPIFRIGSTCDDGVINRVGAVFGSETHDDLKLATITTTVAGFTGDIKEYVADNFGSAVMHLNALEKKLPEVLAQIESEKATVRSYITVAQ